MKIEIWKDIPGYEGRYQVSTEGRIRSLDRRVPCKCHYAGKLFYRTVKGTARQDIYPLFSVMGLREDLFISLSCFHLSGLRKKAWKCCIETGIQQITGLKIYTTEPVWKTFLMCTGKEANGKNCRSMTFKQFDSDSAAELKELSLQQCMT